MSKPRITANASADLMPSERWCACCKKPLVGKFAWLELDTHTGKYSDRGDIQTDHSQGWFPFGMTCARNELAKG